LKGVILLILIALTGCGHCWKTWCRNDALMVASRVPGSFVVRGEQEGIPHDVAVVWLDGKLGHLYVPQTKIWFRKGLPRGFEPDWNKVMTFEQYLQCWQEYGWRGE